MIALDRPGFGLSDPKPGRRLSDWPDDVTDAADALDLDRFAVAGASGGGPFAVACAARIPDRLIAVGVLCGLGPPESRRSGDRMMARNRLGLTLASRAPRLVRAVLGVAGLVVPRAAPAIVAHIARNVRPCDRAALADPDVRRIIAGSFREAFLRGSAGAAADGLIYGRSWDVDPGAIRVPVHFWHGEDDVVVPATMTRWLERVIPDARATYYPGEGHFSLIVRRLPDLFDVLRPVSPA